MQKKKMQKKPVELVYKPIITGSWNGKDARKMALKRALGFLAITLVYLIAGALLSFDSFWLRALMALMVVLAIDAVKCSQK